MTPERTSRRSFLKRAAAAGAVAAGSGVTVTGATAQEASQPPEAPRKIKVGVIGCGSVSRCYFPDLARCRFVELVSTCDIIAERAKQRAAAFKVPNHYPHIDKMLAGAKFDLLVNLTDMQEHGRLNKLAIEAGKHVWSEKPIANTLAQGRELLELARSRGQRVWGAPTVVLSPQFEFMAKTLASGKLGRIAAAHAAYGHLGPAWSSFFFDKGGGSMPDLGVYNITTLTGLLGPARTVVGMTSIVTPTRDIRGKGEIKVEAEDNAMILMDHGQGVLSHVQCGFNYFTAYDHYHSKADHHTISITGTGGSMHLAGYDWAPHAVDLAHQGMAAVDGRRAELKRHASSPFVDGPKMNKPGEYCWWYGASQVAECLATGRQTLMTPEHALHVAEIMAATRESQRTGRRIEIQSTFKWPVVS